MKIIEILPELDIGGVERHVIDLSNELVRRGHEITVISAGGKMQSQLNAGVRHINMPVQKKNPFTGWFCAKKIAYIVKQEKFNIIHAHSRVPAWIARWAAQMSNVPYVVTAHGEFGNKSHWIYVPYRDAARTICVSEAVRESMKDCFYDNTQIILNGLDTPKVFWKNENLNGIAKFLFVGRLSHRKGLQDLLHAMPQNLDWHFDILGDGDITDELKTIAAERNIADRVIFHGYSDKADEFMAAASCLLFPSYIEGMPLTLARAAQIGLPFIASDIPPIAEMTGSHEGLLPPGDIDALHNAIIDFINTRKTKAHIPPANIPTLSKMTDEVAKVYEDVLRDTEGNAGKSQNAHRAE